MGSSPISAFGQGSSIGRATKKTQSEKLFRLRTATKKVKTILEKLQRGSNPQRRNPLKRNL